MKVKSTLFAGLALAALPAAVQAQLYIAGPFHIAAGGVVAVFGDVTSNGTSITGDGTLLLTGSVAQSLGLMGGDVPILEINNTNNVTLTSAVRIEDGLTLTAGHVLLSNSDLIFDPSSVPTGVTSTKYLVTNGTGFVQKEALTSSSSFSFPIGQATGDYTPATVTNGGTTQNVSAAVKSYAASAAVETSPENGCGRSWNIFTSAGGAIGTMALTHNTGTNGAAYNPALAVIVRQQATGVFSSNAAVAYGGPVAPTGESGNPATLTSTSNSYYNNTLVLGSTATSGSASNAWFSKSDDVLGGIQVTPFAFLQGGMNSTNTAMRNDLQTFTLLPTSSTVPYPSVPARDYASINSAAGPAGAVTDWVEVQLRSASTPGAILERRAGLLKTDGSIVTPTGTGPMRFSSPAGNYYVFVDHRNHLGVQTAGAVALTEASGTTVDFRSPATPTFNAIGNNASQSTVGAFRALWAGDVTNDAQVYYNATGNDRDAILTALGGNGLGFNSAYENADVNLDAQTYYNATGNDRDFLLANPLQGNALGFIIQETP